MGGGKAKQANITSPCVQSGTYEAGLLVGL